MSQIFTPEEVAEHFKIEVRLVKRMIHKGWPCIRINRVQIRFTEEHLRQIEQMTVSTQISSLEEKFGRVRKGAL